MAVAVAVAVLMAAVVVATGCASRPAPPPVPPALADAERLARQAAKLQADENWAGAAAWWERAAAQYRLLNREADLALSHHNEAICLRTQGKSAEAHDLLEAASATNQRLGRTNAWWRNQVALLQLEIDANPSPETALARLATLRGRSGEIAGDPGLSAVLAHEEARLLLQTTRLTDADAAADRAEQAFRRAEDAGGGAAVRVLRARIWGAQGRGAEAEAAWREALAAFEQLGQPRGVAVSLAGLGVALAGDPARRTEAAVVLRRAIDNLGVLRMKSEAREAEESLARVTGKSPEPGE